MGQGPCTTYHMACHHLINCLLLLFSGGNLQRCCLSKRTARNGQLFCTNVPHIQENIFSQIEEQTKKKVIDARLKDMVSLKFARTQQCHFYVVYLHRHKHFFPNLSSFITGIKDTGRCDHFDHFTSINESIISD